MASRKSGVKQSDSLLSKWAVGDEKPVKIDKWDGNAVKNALDDAVRKVLTKNLKCVEDHSVVDIRLAICTIACLFAIGALIYDYLDPFPNSRPVLVLCVLSYFFLMGVLTLYTTLKEKNYIVFANEKDKAGMFQLVSAEGSRTKEKSRFARKYSLVENRLKARKGPDHLWSARSTLKKYDDIYELTLSYEDGETRKKDEQSLKKSVASWFDEDGVLHFDMFLNDVMEMHKDLKKEKTL